MPGGELGVAILGVTGRMGRALVAAVDEAKGVVLSGASASPNSKWIGKDVGEASASRVRGLAVSSTAATAIGAAQVAIDFTSPEATGANLTACIAANCPLVLGTTGHDERAREQIAQAARRIAVVTAPNMSLGVNLLLKLVELTAGTLDESYDIEVLEAHHRNKKDAPSGTALALGGVAAGARGVALEEVAEHARHGVAATRRKGAIGFSVFRGGDVVGDHTVTFAGIGERIELTHRASDRMAFARGAVKAAQWVVRREPGLYSMQDVLGLGEAVVR
jgi:4-hydroxy-tetrahydrodipicolinate reductase